MWPDGDKRFSKGGGGSHCLKIDQSDSVEREASLETEECLLGGLAQSCLPCLRSVVSHDGWSNHQPSYLEPYHVTLMASININLVHKKYKHVFFCLYGISLNICFVLVIKRSLIPGVFTCW